MEITKSTQPDYEQLLDDATRNILNKYTLVYHELQTKCSDRALRAYIELEEVEKIKDCSQLYLVAAALLKAWLEAFRNAVDVVSEHIVSSTKNPRFSFDEFSQQNVILIQNSEMWLEDTVEGHIEEALVAAVALSRRLPMVDRLALVRHSIGLTGHQAGIVFNYFQLLQSRSPEALARKYRDQSMDGALLAGALPPDRIRQMMSHYADGLFYAEAEELAYVVASDAVYTASESVIEQAILAGLLISSDITGHWHTRGDSKVRHSHRSMHGQKRPFGQPFLSGAGNHLRFPRDRRAPVSDVANCRCWVSWHF